MRPDLLFAFLFWNMFLTTRKESTKRRILYHRFYKYGKIPQLSIFAWTVHLADRQYKIVNNGVAFRYPSHYNYTMQSAADQRQLSAPSGSGSGWRKTVHG